MRFNFDDEFESVYLRESGFPNGFDKEHCKILNLPETQKVIKHMVKKNLRMAGDFLSAVGIMSADLYSIISVYAIYYTVKFNSRPINYTLMMNFIDQRMIYLMECFSRKEGKDERVTFVGPVLEDLTKSEVFNTATDSYEEMVVQASEDKLDKKITALGARGNGRYSRTQMLDSLKKKLDSDPAKYQRDLVYYAISKHVGEDIRKKARKYCKKYGIDYIEAAKTLFLGKESDNHFDV